MQRGQPTFRHAGQEHADLAVVDLSQSPAPLPLHPPGRRALLGKAAAVLHERGVRIAELLGRVPTHFGHHRFVVPLASADEPLDRPTLHARLQRDRFRGLTFQMTGTALQHQLGVFPLFFPIEPGWLGIDHPFPSAA
jgi:hypothetical protein